MVHRAGYGCWKGALLPCARSEAGEGKAEGGSQHEPNVLSSAPSNYG